jgi:hypothetical protein
MEVPPFRIVKFNGSSMLVLAGVADQARIVRPRDATFGDGADMGYKAVTICRLGRFVFDGWDRPVVDSSTGFKTHIGKVVYEAVNGSSHTGTVRVPMVGRIPWNALLSTINGVELWSTTAE